MDELVFMAGIAKAVAHPKRVAILDLLLRRGEVCVCDIAEVVGVSQPSASKHLTMMRSVGLVNSRREGLMSIYSVEEPAASVLMDALRGLAREVGTAGRAGRS